MKSWARIFDELLRIYKKGDKDIFVHVALLMLAISYPLTVFLVGAVLLGWTLS